MSNYVAGQIQQDVTLTNTAANTGVRANPIDTVDQKTLVTSVKATYSLSNYTPIASVGPLRLFWAHSDYSAAEIEEWIEATTSWSPGDLVQQEIAKRRIREVGVFETPDSSTATKTMNDGKPIRTRLNWILFEGQSIVPFVYNAGSAAMSTTSANVHVGGKANLWTL